MQASQIGYAASSGPVERYFPLARRQSLSWLEFSCQNPVNFPQTFDRTRTRRVRSLVDRSGVRCGLHSASFVNTAEIMPTVRKAAEAHLREYVDLTVALGCEYLVVHCGFHFSAYLKTVRAALYETMARCVEYGERRRVPLVIENMNPLPGDSEFQYLGVAVEEFQALFDRIRSPYLGLALDVAHSELVRGGTVSFVRAFGARIHSAQLSDNRGRVDEHMTIAPGRSTSARVLGALSRIGFSGPLIIELFDVPKKLVSHRRLLALLARVGEGAAGSAAPPGRRPPRAARGPGSPGPSRGDRTGAERLCDREPRGARGGQEAAGQPDRERPHEALAEQRPGDAEVEGHLGEGVEVERGQGDAVAVEIRECPAYRAAQQRQGERLDHHGHDHRQAAEPDGPERGDLDLPARDRRVHAVQRAERRAHRHEPGHRVAEHVDQAREHRRLLRVVLGLLQDADREARIAADRVPEGLEAGARAVGQPGGERLEPLAPERRHGDLGVAPDLRLVDVAAGREDADHRPVAVPERDARADAEAGELPRGLSAHDHLPDAALERPPLHELELVSHGEGRGLDASEGDVVGLALTPPGKVDHHHELRRRERAPRGIAGDAG